MRFEVRKDEKSKKAEFEVSFIVTTRCVINDSKRITVALGDVKLNHRDKFDLRIGAREALKEALRHGDFTPTGRTALWKAYCKAFGIKTKEGYDLKHELVPTGGQANA